MEAGAQAARPRPGLAALAGLGRRGVTGLPCASGQQFGDWSAAYQRFLREQFAAAALATRVEGLLTRF